MPVITQTQNWANLFSKSADNFIARIENQKQLYSALHMDYANSNEKIIHLNETAYIEKIISYFGPCLPQEKAKISLASVFEAAYHPNTGSLIIANRGTTLLSKTPNSNKDFLLYHMGCVIMNPLLGQETVNIGIVGNIYNNPVIVRGESACAPSFLFSTQRCNCCYQWASTKELAAHLNPCTVPQIQSNIQNSESSDPLEMWVSRQFKRFGHQILPVQNGPGMILIHLDSQSGMGAGFSAHEFSYDLSSRALLRQTGENTVAQLYHTSIKEGNEALGLVPDARKEEHNAGYKTTRVILDFLAANNEIILLSNNKDKISALTEAGYQCRRVKSLGKIEAFGLTEAQQRNHDFQHMDIGSDLISFDAEVERLLKEIS